LRFGFRVGWPFVGQDLNVTEGRPPDVFPCPPPCGWSTGFIATPRTLGRQPIQRVRPAFLRLGICLFFVETIPIVANAAVLIIRFFLEGLRTVLKFLIFFESKIFIILEEEDIIW